MGIGLDQHGTHRNVSTHSERRECIGQTLWHGMARSLQASFEKSFLPFPNAIHTPIKPLGYENMSHHLRINFVCVVSLTLTLVASLVGFGADNDNKNDK